MYKKAMFISVHGDPLADLGSIQAGGQNVYVRQLASFLEKHGWSIDVFTHWNSPDQKQIEHLGKRSRVIRFAAGKQEFVDKNSLFKLLPHFLKEIKDFCSKRRTKYELIHSNYWLSGWVGKYLKNFLGIPQVHTSHSLGLVRSKSLKLKDNPEMKVRLKVEKSVFEEARAIVATSSTEKEIIVDGYKADKEKIHVIPCGLDSNHFRMLKRKSVRSHFGLENEKVVLFVGRFDKNKGLEVLLRSIPLLLSSYPRLQDDVEFWIIGGDPKEVPLEEASPEKRELVSLLDNLGVRPKVKFLGPKEHKELPLYYNAAEVCVVPSFYESFGLVAVEAMACGCPVIASNVGGLKYTVMDGTTGFLVPPKNSEALAETIGKVFQDNTLCKRLSRNAVNIIPKKFSWQTIAEQINNLYKEITECPQTLSAET